jgi:hypothetical protein
MALEPAGCAAGDNMDSKRSPMAAMSKVRSAYMRAARPGDGSARRSSAPAMKPSLSVGSTVMPAPARATRLPGYLASGALLVLAVEGWISVYCGHFSVHQIPYSAYGQGMFSGLPHRLEVSPMSYRSVNSSRPFVAHLSASGKHHR